MSDATDLQEPEADVKMTIWEHLQELRKRVLYAAIGTLVGTIGCWTFRVKLLAWLIVPYEKEWKAHFPNIPLELQTLAPADAFVNYLQLAITGGIVLAIPIIFYQLWAFVSPGLYAREKKYIIPFVFFSTILFLSGVAFAYYVAFPFTFNYFFSLLGPVNETGTLLTSRPTMEFYMDFTTRMLLAFGFVFELPLFISFLAMAGIVTPRQLLKFSRWAIILSFALGAIITPGPEISSQIAVSGALVGLYFLSVGVSFIVAKKRDEPEEEAEEPAPKKKKAKKEDDD
jgi:sec-independent protein translocase protein TatC